MKKPKVMVIGAGTWGRKIIHTLDVNHSTIAYISHSGSKETVEFLSKNHPQIPRVETEEGLLDRELEAVVIATPIHTHFAIAKKALAAGKHVFVEKPLTCALAEVTELYALAEKSNLTLFTGYIYLFATSFQKTATQMVSANDIEIISTWRKHGSFDSSIEENLLVHELALCSYLLGPLRLEEVARRDQNYIEITVSSERGHARILIDRDASPEVKEKKMSITAGGKTYECMFNEPHVLDRELATFFDECTRGSSGNKKRQHIDESIAAVLEALA